MRSLLIAPGDDEAKLEAALSSQADAVVIDLCVGNGARAAAARVLNEAGAGPRKPALMIRVSPLGDAETDLDLDAVMGSEALRQAPVAVVLPKALFAGVQQLSARLAVREALRGLEDGSIRIVAVADTAEALLAMACARAFSPRLIGLAWDAETLRADIGAGACRNETGSYAGPFALARDMTLLAATAAGVAAIDTACMDSSSVESLRAEALAARRDGFRAKLAIDPDQARIINSAFGPRG